MTSTNMIKAKNNIKPYYIHELGCEGLSTKDIAESTREDLKVINRKVMRPAFRRRCDLMGYELVTAGTKSEGRGRPGKIHYMCTAAAKAVVATLENSAGYGYLDFLLTCEESVPVLVARLEEASKTIAFLKNQVAISQSKPKSLPGKRTDMIAAPIYHENIFGVRDIISYELRAKETLDEITKLKAQIRHMNKIVKGLGSKLDLATEKLYLEEARKDNKILKLVKAPSSNG